MDELQRDVSELKTTLERVEDLVQSNARSLARSLAQLRDDLIGERRALAAQSVFAALADRIDQMRQMRGGLDPARDGRMLAQLEAVLESLAVILRALGFAEFTASPGDAFDPHSMQVAGYTAGPEGVVVGSILSGYRVGQSVLRPATVTIGENTPSQT